MSKRAILYTRVSTDEQNNGYSPADQKDKLYKYCEANGIHVVGFYHDDESAKSFDRPEWKRIMQFLKRNKGEVNTICFVKWDRFSRNAADAFIEIKALRKLGVEPLAIEQPLDFDIPETKIMLAIYLAAPEVDNDRRALNIFNGIRRAKKEGRWLGGCPIGYKNARDENNKPVIIPEGGLKEALVKKAFTEFATGLYHIEDLRKKLNKEGLVVKRAAFWVMLRNKGYLGLVYVPAYKDEKEEWVKGKHKAIINEQTFYSVQEVLAGRKRNIPLKNMTLRDEFPLRGYLTCPSCGNPLTASTSTNNRGAKYNYYHCQKGCKERQKALDVNVAFIKLLKEIKTSPESMSMYGQVLKDKLKESGSFIKKEKEKIEKEITTLNQRLKNARALMLDGEFSSDEYKEIKTEIENAIAKATFESGKLSSGIGNSDKQIDNCIELLSNIEKYYEQRDTAIKQRIISSIFPGKLIFENKKYRTAEINSVIPQICRRAKAFRDAKKEKRTKILALSGGVVSPRIELGSKV